MTNREKRAKAAREKRFLERMLTSPTGRAPQMPKFRLSWPSMDRPPMHGGKLANYTVQARFASREDARAFERAAAEIGIETKFENADFAEIEKRALAQLADAVNDVPLWAANGPPITSTELLRRIELSGYHEAVNEKGGGRGA